MGAGEAVHTGQNVCDGFDMDICMGGIGFREEGAPGFSGQALGREPQAGLVVRPFASVVCGVDPDGVLRAQQSSEMFDGRIAPAGRMQTQHGPHVPGGLCESLRGLHFLGWGSRFRSASLEEIREALVAVVCVGAVVASLDVPRRFRAPWRQAGTGVLTFHDRMRSGMQSKAVIS